VTRKGAITAEQALLAAGIDPAEVRRALPMVDPAKARITPAPAWYRRTWSKGIIAVTMPWGISVTPEVHVALHDPAQAPRYGTLVVHELAHLDQYHRLGATRHLARYARDYVTGRWHGRSHWDAYRDVGLEVEARRVAERFTPGREQS
jgi:hypothetical protein